MYSNYVGNEISKKSNENGCRGTIEQTEQTIKASEANVCSHYETFLLFPNFSNDQVVAAKIFITVISNIKNDIRKMLDWNNIVLANKSQQ